MQVCLWKRLEFSISLTALGKTLLNAGQLFLLALANNTFHNICIKITNKTHIQLQQGKINKVDKYKTHSN